ncbi:uncharacterized protein LOC134353192 [Mobula hypostoma]|uniref:uncharacterized protein LOC134353192 n=1 Tax=Mobula hypostoma TaxID=723540 RepID=UPI002FC32FFB
MPGRALDRAPGAPQYITLVRPQLECRMQPYYRKKCRSFGEDAEEVGQDSAWSLSAITSYKVKPSDIRDSRASLPDELNAFYACFDRQNIGKPSQIHTALEDPVISDSEAEVRVSFKEVDRDASLRISGQSRFGLDIRVGLGADSFAVRNESCRSHGSSRASGWETPNDSMGTTLIYSCFHKGAVHNPDLMETAVRSTEEHLEKLLKCLLHCRCYCAIENLRRGRPQILGFAYCLLSGPGSKRSAEMVLGAQCRRAGRRLGVFGRTRSRTVVGCFQGAASVSLRRWRFTVCVR